MNFGSTNGKSTFVLETGKWAEKLKITSKGDINFYYLNHRFTTRCFRKAIYAFSYNAFDSRVHCFSFDQAK